jgi:hypothetical protein
MYTSIVLVAMLGPGAAPYPKALESLSWQESYSGARQVGRQQKKPLAVFIGAGRDGWRKVCRGQTLPAVVRDLLTANYVCLYIDTQTEPGKRLAEEFEMVAGPGLVLSSPDGEDQVFRHAGPLSATHLQQSLRKHSGQQAVSHSYVVSRASTPVRAARTSAAPTYAAPAYRGYAYPRRSSYPGISSSFRAAPAVSGGGC